MGYKILVRKSLILTFGFNVCKKRSSKIAAVTKKQQNMKMVSYMILIEKQCHSGCYSFSFEVQKMINSQKVVSVKADRFAAIHLASAIILSMCLSFCCMFVNLPSRHMTSKCRRSNVDATSFARWLHYLFTFSFFCFTT